MSTIPPTQATRFKLTFHCIANNRYELYCVTKYFPNLFTVVLCSSVPFFSGEAVIIDARSEGRFYGTAPEPRPGMRGGHIPR